MKKSNNIMDDMNWYWACYQKKLEIGLIQDASYFYKRWKELNDEVELLKAVSKISE